MAESTTLLDEDGPRVLGGPEPTVVVGEAEKPPGSWAGQRILSVRVPLRDVQISARHADPRTTIYDRRRQNFDRPAAEVVVAFVAGG